MREGELTLTTQADRRGIRTEPSDEELQRKKQWLIDQGVEYAFGSWADFYGRPKAKAVPINRFESMVRGSELYTVGALPGMGPLGPHEDECEAVADIDSLVICPWDRRYAYMSADLVWHGRPYEYCPRSLLKRVLDEARQMGFVFNLGFEPEVYVLREAPNGDLLPLHPDDTGFWGYDVQSTLDGMTFLDVMVRYLDELGWGVFSFDHEGGNSQYEFDFGYTDALTQSDRFTFMRLMLKEVAKKLGAFATFMPKPYSDNFGSGAHYNMSLADVDSGVNVFEDPDGPNGLGYSSLAYHFVGGLLKHAGAITAVTCPTVNSYKRLIGRGFMDDITWAPVFVRYGDNNRTLMIRLPKNRRCVENRAADIASNMYFGAAISLAAGLEGIKEQIDPGPLTNTNLYELNRRQLQEEGVQLLPRTLLEAVNEFEADPLTDTVFGPLKSVFVELKNKEWEEYHNVVTDWERQKYLKFF
jgi:glutamine synthetase